MQIKVNIDPAKIGAKIDKAWEKARGIVFEEILNDSNQYVKVDTHALEASALIHSKPAEGLIIWETPYAKRQYWEIQTAVTDVNPQATWRWFEKAKAEHMKTWERQIEKAVKNNL